MTGLLSIILVGAAVAPATPVKPAEWFSSKDHPKTAMMVAERGYVAYTIDIAPDGSPIRCQTESATDLDGKVCDILRKNARFLPATDDRGAPAFARYEGVASFLMPGKGRQRPDPSRLSVPVDQLPDGIASPAYAKVALLVDAAAAIRHCASTTPERRRFLQTVEALGPVACDTLARQYRPVPVRNAAGDPVASVQTVVVRFDKR